MPSLPHLILRLVACLSISAALTGCSSADSRAQKALQAYQAAAAANDLPTARKALLDLVRAKEDVPDYWVELGKLQASMGSYGDAYYAFTRAYELDRSNPELLRAVTELALRSGDINLALKRARELEVLSPGNPWVKIVDGWAAVGDMQYDKALLLGDQLLTNSPYDPAGTTLKARALIGLDRNDEAEQLLTRQLQAQPTDLGNGQMLEKFYVWKQDWPRAAAIARKIWSQAPNDRFSALLVVAAAFRSGNVGEGREASARLLKPNADPGLVGSVLDLWANYWPSPQRQQDAITFAQKAAGIEQKLAYARFLSRIGDSLDAARLVSPSATLPVDARNAEANAVLGDALFRLGKFADAQSRLDRVIAFDPGNATALRAQAELALKTGNSSRAIVAAQKLVTVLPKSADDRLLLARSYTAAGNTPWANRTLWSAFQEIPANDAIYAALISQRKGDPDATQQLRDEFGRQRYAQLSRGIF